MVEVDDGIRRALKHAVGIENIEQDRLAVPSDLLSAAEALAHIDPSVATAIVDDLVVAGVAADEESAVTLVEAAGTALLKTLEQSHSAGVGAARGVAADIALGVAANAAFASCQVAWLATTRALRNRRERQAMDSYARALDAIGRASQASLEDPPT